MFDLIYTTAVLILLSVSLIKEWLRPSITVFAALLLLVAGKVISVDEAFAGFSNQGMLTVACLFVISAALQNAGGFNRMMTHLLGNRDMSNRSRYFRLMLPVSGFSAFLNNTPIVASLVPVIKSWAKCNDIPASKYLIPLSYAAILGGMCTLIGTSTNLVVHGMLIDRGLPGLGFFEITKIGLPVAILGILYVALIGHRLLPANKDPIAQLGESTREFMVEMKVTAEYPHAGKSVEAAGLRHLQGLFLFQIHRGAEIIAPVSHTEIIRNDDRLFFTGLPDTIYELQKTLGLHIIKDSEFDLKNIDSDRLKTYEAVISKTSSLIGQTVRDSNFRHQYDAVILAIHRAGSRINKKVGDIIFQPGDTLFIMAHNGFDKKWYNSRSFALVSSSLDIYSKPQWKGNLALGMLLVMILLVAFKIVPMLIVAAAVAALMVIVNIINPDDALKAVDFGVLLIIASAFGIGRALENSGLAERIAAGAIEPLGVFGPVGIIAGVFFITSIYTELITNNAAAAIMFPIALSTARVMQLDPRPLILTLTLAASASFATPIGYQTNTMVYSPGGYRFKDFLKIGVVMNVFVGICVTGIVCLIFY